ncbi:MAG TPA: pyridoxamine 5'-phosphate oxidase family protein, partial [Planctomycetota bacterium]|nr:pyridoxamine 5'-phosphate oxidase family protein [Planctomycetota bacterium]
HLVFATERDTRKYANLAADPRVALLVDDRSHRAADLVEATAATAEGPAREALGNERERLAARLLGKHPALRPFVAHPGCALIVVTVEVYQVVTRFQSVVEFCPAAYT